MKRAIGATVFLLGVVSGVMAQESTGNVYGHLVDEQGRGLAGAAVTLTGPTTAPQNTTSDARGDFHFLQLAPATYQVAAALPGFTKLTRDNVVVTLGKNTELKMTLRLSAVEETVEVSSETPIVDSRKTESGTVFSQDELQKVPTGRDVWVMMQQVPGVLVDRVNVAGNQSAQQADFVGKGSYQSTYALDGVNVTDNAANGFSSSYFDFDTIEELQIATGGSDMRLNNGGVLINLVTKRGTNQLKGSARLFYAGNQLQSSNTPGEVNREFPAGDFTSDETRFIREYGAEVGGPILKDRIWLWGAGSRQDVNLNKTGETDFLGNPLHTDSTLENWTGKLTANAVPSNTITLFYNRNEKLVSGRGADINHPQEATYNQTGAGTILKAQDDQVFSASFFGSAFFAYIDEPFFLNPVGGPNAQVFFDNGGVTEHNSALIESRIRPQHQVNVTASKFFNTGGVGHELKFGFGYRHTVSESYSAWPGDQIFGSEISEDSTYAAVTRAADTKFQMDYFEGYASDTLTTGNLTVNAGLRYDYQRAKNLPGAVGPNPVFPEVLPAVNYPGNSNYPVSYHNLEPRIGATYALDPKKKTLLRLSYARFADQLRNTIYQINGLPVVSGVYYYWTDSNHDKHVQKGEVDIADGPVSYYHVNPFVAPGTPNVIDSNYRAPTTDEIIVGLDRELLPEFAVAVNYTYRHIGNIQRDRPVGSGVNDYTLAKNVSGTASNDTAGFVLNYNVPLYALPTAPSGTEYFDQSGVYQTYNGIDLQIVKRLSHKWMVRATFAYNDWRQHIPASSIFNPNNLYGGTNDNGGLAVPSGTSYPGYDARWQFNVAGLYQLPYGVNVAANLFGRQGYSLPFYVSARAPSGYDRTRQFLQVGHVDDFRLDNVYELDMRLEKAIPIGPVNLSASIDVFNVTNNNTILNRDTQVNSSTFYNATEVQSPRIVRLGVRVAF